MKSIVLSVCLLLSFSIWASVHPLLGQRSDTDFTMEENGNNISVLFQISQLETIPESNKDLLPANFERLKFKQLQLTSEAGKPSLPFHSFVVKGLPEEYRVQYELGAARVLADVIPAPAQPEYFRCGTCRQPSLDIDWKSYTATTKRFFQMEYLGEFRGTHLTRITLYPVQFNGAQNQLVIYPQAQFDISRAETKGNIDLDALVMPEEIIREADLNKKYIIITPKKFTEAMQRFVNWKTELGYEVSLYELEDIGNTSADVQKFIADLYKNPVTQFTYALLVGHERSFPTFYRRTSSSSRTPSDLPYFTFGGASDYIPDVFYGRFVADNTTEIENIISKTIEYETQHYADASGLNRTVGLASNEGSNPSDVDYVKAMLNVFQDTYAQTPKFFFQTNYDSTPSNLNAALSKGVAWLNYIGHGSGTSWPSMYNTYSSSHVSSIDSYGKVKPVVIDVACQNGNYTYGAGKLGVAFMTATHNGQPTGAVAYYGGSVNISWHPPAIMAVGTNRIIAKRSLEHLGEALLAGHFYLTANYSTLSAIQENYTWYMLQGDPSLHLNF